MITSDSKIRISYMEQGSILKSRGSYTSAEIKVTDAFKANEKMEIIKESKILEEAVYTSSKKSNLLGKHFIIHWLKRESWKPSEKLYNSKDRLMYAIYKDWKKLTKEEILIAAAKVYLMDFNIDYTTAFIDIL